MQIELEVTEANNAMFLQIPAISGTIGDDKFSVGVAGKDIVISFGQGKQYTVSTAEIVQKVYEKVAEA